jgi:hypothetical protein
MLAQYNKAYYICTINHTKQYTMKARTFVSGAGSKITTSDAKEIKRLKACGWKEIKTPKQVYAKGLDGKNFLN